MTTSSKSLRSLIATGALAVVGCFAAPVTASGFTSGGRTSTLASALDQQALVSANWSGYIAGGDSTADSAENFSSVSGSWVQPSVTCSSGETESAFWVGLGGDDSQSDALEQAGTEADCTSTGKATYYAWYELLPAAPVRLGLTVDAGDHISTTVSVGGTSVTVVLKDTTTGASETKNLYMADPDVSSAEWIAEAPSACVNDESCEPLPLADFGSVTFTSASAAANGQTAPISGWSAEPMELSSSEADSGLGADGYGAGGYRGVDDEASGGAVPSSLTSSGSSFSVTWRAGAEDEGTTSGSGYGAEDPYDESGSYEGDGETGAYEDGSGYGGYGYYEGDGAFGGGYGGYGYYEGYGETSTYRGYDTLGGYGSSTSM